MSEEFDYKSVKANGLNIFYFEKGEGQPLILLHGGSINAEMNWRVNIEILSKRFRCIAIDSRGHGRTANPSREYSYEVMADDIAAFITELGLENPVVCGWSDGGQIALEMGIRHPDKVKAIIPGGSLKNKSKQIDEFFGTLGMNGPGIIDFDKFMSTSAGWVQTLVEAHKTQGSDYWKTLLEDLTTLWLSDSSYPGDKVTSIEIPTLIMQADRDEVIPNSFAIDLLDSIKNSELAIVPAATHGLSMGGRSSVFTTLVFDFIERVNKNTSSN